jgi:hypothetical protein
MESAAVTMCRFFFDELVDRQGARACALVRCYKTHPLGELPADLASFARGALQRQAVQVAESRVRCLTLLGTAGTEAAWNDRRLSAGHRAIPLATPAVVAQAPMIAQLLSSFGVDVSELVTEAPDVVRDRGGRSYGVFHVPEAVDSPYIPAQDFVRDHGIRSVVGCGGSLQSGNLFALILFSRVSVSAESADRFRTLALDLKSALFLYGDDETFES